MNGRNYQDTQEPCSHGAQDAEVKKTSRQIIY